MKLKESGRCGGNAVVSTEKEGEWLFGKYSIADAMFAPIALRLSGYSTPLDDVGKAYVRSVLNQPAIIEWIEAGRTDREAIEEDEIDALQGY